MARAEGDNVHKEVIRAERGLGKLTLLVFGTIIGVVLYSAYNIIPFYYYYYELMNQMRSVIRVASTEDDATIRERLWYHIRKMGLPAQPEDLIIERYHETMRIALDYEEVFYVSWGDKDYTIYQFPFHAEVEESF
jgi:hypothetical protein